MVPAEMTATPPHPSAVSVTIGEWLRQSSSRHPDKVCFELADRSSTRTFGEVDDRVTRLVNALTAAGIGRGDRIAIAATDRVEYVETILAAMQLGATYVPLNFRLTAGEMHQLLDRAHPAALFHDARYGRLAEDRVGLRVAVAYDGTPIDPGGVRYDDFIDGAASTPAGIAAGDDDVLGLAFTSGTTGLPKGVLQSQRMIKHMVMNCLVDYRVRPDDVRYNAAPLFHISGMAMTLMAIAIGSTTVIAPQFDAATTVRLLADDRLTACFLVPTMISALLGQPGVDDHPYDRLELMMYGAAPMTPALLRRCIDVFRCDFLNAFGAGTEAGLQTVLTPADHLRALDGRPELLGSIGRPATGVSLRLIGADGHDVEPGDVGEIVTRGDSVMDGYLDMPEATHQALRDGWFRAGDLASQDPDGYLYLAGRADDMIIRGGENLHPLEIETVISEHPAIDQAAVVGVADDHWGQVVHAYVIAGRGQHIDTADLAAHCRERLAAYKVPAAWFVVDELPLNASGKVLRRELRPPSDRLNDRSNDRQGASP